MIGPTVFAAFAAFAAPDFAVKPYLQRPATDAMTVIFFTTEPCGATVEAWLANAARPEVAPYRATTRGELAEALTNNLACVDGPDRSRANDKLYRHRARFTDLKPNRIYEYSVELAGGVKYENAFRTAPGRDTPIRFVAYADCETTATPFDNYVKNLAQMEKREPDFVAIPGDLVARGGIQSHWDGFWKANAGASGTIASSIPLLTVLGNHDLYDNGVDGDSAGDYKYDLQGETGTERYLAYFENEPNGVDFTAADVPAKHRETKDVSQLFYRTDYGPVTLIFLDSNNGDDEEHDKDTNYEMRSDDKKRFVPGIERAKGGRHPDFNIGSPQYAWLTNQLADAQAKSRFTFVFNHHCPWSVGSHNNSPTSGKTGGSSLPLRFLTETFIRYGVDGWICGHDEVQEHSLTNGWEELPGGERRRHTLSVYDLGPSGDTVRDSYDLVNPIEYFRAYKHENANYRNAGFLEVDVMTNRNGKWTCSLTPRYVKGGNAYAFKDQIILEEESGEIVYKEHDNETKPADWLEYVKPPEDRDKGDIWTEEPKIVTVTTITWNGGRMSGERQRGFATKPGLWYAWGRNGKPATKWVEGDGTPLTLQPPDSGTWDLLVTDFAK